MNVSKMDVITDVSTIFNPVSSNGTESIGDGSMPSDEGKRGVLVVETTMESPTTTK